MKTKNDIKNDRQKDVKDKNKLSLKGKNKKALTDRIAGFITGRPIVSLVLGLLLVAIFIPGLQKLGADFSYRIWFSEDDPLLKSFDSFERRFGNDERVAIVLHSPSGVFDKESVAILQDLTRELWQVPEIVRVDSLSNYNWTHSVEDDIVVEPLLPDDEEMTPQLLEERKQVALSHEVLPGYLVGKDGKTAVLYASIKPSFEGSPNYELIIHGDHRDPTGEVFKEGIRDKIAKYQGKGDHSFYVTGPGAISDAFREASVHDLSTLVPILLAVIVFSFLILLRRFSALMLAFAVILLTLLVTFGFSGLVGIRFNNVIATLPNTLIAIAIADVIHILVTFFQYKRSALPHKEAVHKTLTKNLFPTFLTSISTAIGLFSFITAKVQPISHMGFLAGFGVMAAWGITIFIIGALLTLIPITVKINGGRQKKGTLKESLKENLTEPKTWAVAMVRGIEKWKVPIIAVSIVLTVFAGYLGLQNEVNSDPFKYFPEGFHLRTANDFLEEHVGGASGVEVVIDAGKADGIKDPVFLQKVERFQGWLNEFPHVTKTVSIIDILKQTNRSLHGDDPACYRLPETQAAVAQQLFLYTMSLPQGMDLNDRMTIDNDAMRLTVMWTLTKSREATEAFDIIKGKAESLGLNVLITGKTTLYQSMNGYVVSSFVTSLLIAIFGISLLLVLTFRSVKIGVMAIIPNLIPLILGAALMTILQKPLDIGTVIVASICLGIAVDDTIHFLSGFYRWRKAGYDNAKAIAMVFTQTGPALLVTTLILASGFGTFAFAFFVPNINFGILTALILTAALLADLVLLPAIMLLKPGRQAVHTGSRGGTGRRFWPAAEKATVRVRT